MSTARRYPASVMLRCRELREAGWTLDQIRDLIARETGWRPAKTTIAIWCYGPEQRAARRRTQNRENARRRAASSRPSMRLSPEWKRAKMRELYLRGVGLRAIGQAAAVFWGEEMTEKQVLRGLGLKRGDVVRVIGERRAA